MKKWLIGMTGLFCASVVGFAAMSAAAMAGRDEQPAVLRMFFGDETAFSPVAVSGRLTDINSTSAWWEQNTTFQDGVQTESAFYSSIEGQSLPYEPISHSTVVSNSTETEILGIRDKGSGRYFLKDYIDRYSYSVNFWEDDLGLWANTAFPWLWSAVGAEDYVEVAVSDGSVSTSSSISGVSADIVPIRLEDGWYFTLPNSFHGARSTNSATGEPGEPVQYGGSSGIFFLPGNSGGPLYYDDNGAPIIEQVFSLPISSEGDRVVLRLDWVGEAGLFSLLAAEGDVLTLRLFDPVTRQALEPVALGPSVLRENATVIHVDGRTEIIENQPDSCTVRAQGDLLLILQGGGTGFPSRAIVVKVSRDGAEILQNVAVEISRYYDDYDFTRADSWMFWQDGVLYVMEARQYWSADLMLYAIDAEGLTALGVLENAGARLENTAGFARAGSERRHGGLAELTAFPSFRGWKNLRIAGAG